MTAFYIWMSQVGSRGQMGAPINVMRLDDDLVYAEFADAATAQQTTIVCPGEPGTKGILGILPKGGDGRVKAGANPTADANSPAIIQDHMRYFEVTAGDKISVLNK